MSVSWADRYDHQQVIQLIESRRKHDDAGRLVFEGFAHKEHVALLYDMLVFPEAIPEVEGRRFVNQATFKAGEKGVITAKSFLSEVNKLTNDYLKHPVEPFVLATSVSLDGFTELPPMRASGTAIRFEHHLPKRFSEERKKILPRVKETLFAEAPTSQ